MGYLSCNAESAIATCDPYNWDRTRRKKNKKLNTTNQPITNNINIKHFAYSELVQATNAFSADTFLGKGSHGTVYKASLYGGTLIAAVKKTYPNPSADNEIEILSRLHHPRLVNLLGFSSDPNTRKLLVVEFMPNGSLHSLLHCSSSWPGWTRRVRFALQIAKAVQFLHSANPPVIHRDIKSSNVLIDVDWKARLGDFGLALRGHVEDVRVKCTPPAGTLGYLDPGYLGPGDLSAKNDVFSFGILLLEIISGRDAIDVNYSPPSIVDWAVPLIKRGDFVEICDNRIGSPVDPRVVKSLAVLAARCVRSTAEKRPTMAEVVKGLKVVSRRVQAPAVWNRLRRRSVRRAAKESRRLASSDESREEVVNRVTVRNGSRRNSRVSSIEYGDEMVQSGEDRIIIRSKSIGSYGEIKRGGSDSNRRKEGGGAAVRIPIVQLSKSRSMGVLQSPRLLHYNNNNNNNNNTKGFAFEIEREMEWRKIEGSMSKLFIGLDEEEKPLVSI